MMIPVCRAYRDGPWHVTGHAQILAFMTEAHSRRIAPAPACFWRCGGQGRINKQFVASLGHLAVAFDMSPPSWPQPSLKRSLTLNSHSPLHELSCLLAPVQAMYGLRRHQIMFPLIEPLIWALSHPPVRKRDPAQISADSSSGHPIFSGGWGGITPPFKAAEAISHLTFPSEGKDSLHSGFYAGMEGFGDQARAANRVGMALGRQGRPRARRMISDTQSTTGLSRRPMGLVQGRRGCSSIVTKFPETDVTWLKNVSSD